MLVIAPMFATLRAVSAPWISAAVSSSAAVFAAVVSFAAVRLELPSFVFAAVIAFAAVCLLLPSFALAAVIALAAVCLLPSFVSAPVPSAASSSPFVSAAVSPLLWPRNEASLPCVRLNAIRGSKGERESEGDERTLFCTQADGLSQRAHG